MRLFNSLDSFHRLGILAVLSNVIYLAWLAFNIEGPLGVPFYIFETMICLVAPLFVFNHWKRRFDFLGGPYSMRSSVDVYIPTVNEPTHMLLQTIEAAKEIIYARKNIYVLDDGNRPVIKKLCTELGVEYIARQNSKDKRYKAANLNYAMRQTHGDYILVIDADGIVSPNIIDDLLGHFKDKQVGIVASRQRFSVDKDDFNHDHLFYVHMQSGKNADNAAISCGSGVIYRRSAIKKIGGFSEWNIVEDLHTTYLANAHKIKSVYVSQAYVVGHAPRDVQAIYKQRGTWATDTLRMFFWQQPLFNFKLSFRQRMHYFEMGYTYLVSGFALTGVYLVNFVALVDNQPVVTDGLGYLIFRVPAIIFTLMFFDALSESRLTSRIWAGLFPVYFLATIVALTHPHRKPTYKVTPKKDIGNRNPSRVFFQVGFIGLGVFSSAYHYVFYGISSMLVVSIVWIGLMTYWLMPIIEKALKIGAFRHELNPKKA